MTNVINKIPMNINENINYHIQFIFARNMPGNFCLQGAG